MGSGLKKRIAAVLTFMMIAETVSGGFTDIFASSGQDIQIQEYAEDTVTDILSDKAETGEAEGEVIVCVRETSEMPAEDSAEAVTADSASFDLLDSAETLMDVTEAADEFKQEEEPETGKDYDLSNETAFAWENVEKTMLKFIHSDEYSTSQLIEMLSARDDVLFVEPNHIYKAEEPSVEGFETAYNTEDGVPENETSGYEANEGEDLISRGNDAGLFVNAEDDILSEHDPYDIPAEGEWDGKKDLTYKQYAYGNGAGGMDIPGWNTTSQNAKGVVAVIDTGVDYNNPDLKDVMWDRGLEYPELVELGGGKYGIAPAGSAEFGYSTDDPMDRNGHGTHCAGIIAAAWNGFGVSGAANGVKIMACNNYDHKNAITDKNLLKCFNYVLTAKKAGVDVVAVNNSWGGLMNSQVYRYIVRELGKAGVVVCFSAGNDNYDIDLNCRTAASFGGEANEITIGSNDSDGNKSEFSNYGIRSTDVFAPGTEILSTYPAYLGDLYGSLAVTAKDKNTKLIRDDYETVDLDRSYFSYGNTEYSHPLLISDNTVKWTEIGNKSLVIPVVSGNTDGNERCPVLNVGVRGKDQLPGGEYEVIIKHRATMPNVSLELYVKTIDGEFVLADSNYSQSTWGEAVYKLPFDADLYDLNLVLDAVPDSHSDDPYFVYIDEIRLTEEREGTPFALMSGTSMATPAVTGAVAVVAKTFPNDSADKRAARILAGVEINDKLVTQCAANGIVNVRNSLNEAAYNPVIQKVWLDETNNKLNVAGYFFGERAELKLKQSGKEVDILPLNIYKDEKADGYCTLTTDIPEWLESGELEIYLINNDKDDRNLGMRIVSVKRSNTKDNKYYPRIALPQDPEFEKTGIDTMCAVNGRIVITGSINDGETAVTWIYNIASGKFEKCLKGSDAISATGNMCAWNKKLVYTDDKTCELRIFDPATGKVVDSALINGIILRTQAPLFYLTKSNDLLCFVGQWNPLGINLSTIVYEIDTDHLTASKIGGLDGDYTGNAIVGEDQDGNVFITNAKMTGLAKFKIVKDDGQKSELGNIEYFNMKSTDDMLKNNETLKGCAVNEGMILINGCTLSTNSTAITADNYFLDFGKVAEDNTGFEISSNRIAPFRFIKGNCTAYGNKVYFLGMTYDEGMIFSYSDAFSTTDTGDRPVEEPTGKVKITLAAQNEGEVLPGKKIKMTVTTDPVVRADRIRWYSEEGTIASVDQKGIVTGKRPGSTLIYATVDVPFGYKKAYRVYVNEPTTSISLSEKNIKMAEGCVVDLKANAEPLGGASQKFNWVVKEPSSCSNLIKVVEKKKKDDKPTEIKIYAGSLPDKVDSAKATVTFRATDGSKKTAKLTVTVYRATKSINIKQGSKEVTNSVISMVENKSVGLKAIVTPGKTASNSLNWWSTDTSVASVKNGKVTATGHGSARIYVQSTDGTNKKAYCTVSVNAPVRKAGLDTEGTIYLGKDTEQNVSINRVTPDECGDYSVSWLSSEPDIVSVSVNRSNADSAVIHAKNTGSAKIWAVITNKDRGGRETVKTNVITVMSVQSSASANKIAILSGSRDITDNDNISDNAAARVKAGKVLNLKALAYDKSNNKIKKPYFVWTSSDPSVAAVTNGKVRAYKEGVVSIGVHMVPPAGSTEWKSEYCLIYVYEPVTKISIDYEEMKNVKSITFTSASSPDDTVKFKCSYTTKEKSGNDKIREDKLIQWRSSKPDVLSFISGEDGEALFLPRKTGTAWITAKALDGSNRSVRCKVTVIGSVVNIAVGFKGKLPVGVSVNDTKGLKGSKDMHGLKAGDSFTINPIITPSTAADKKVLYISSDPNVAVVDQGGKVTIKKAIEKDIYITVITADGGLMVACVLKKD